MLETFTDHEQDVLRDITKLAKNELDRANEIYPLFQTPHEGHAIIDEEVQEALEEMQSISDTMDYLKDEIRRSKGYPHEPSTEELKVIEELMFDVDKLILEAIQVKAMLMKYGQSFERTE